MVCKEVVHMVMVDAAGYVGMYNGVDAVVLTVDVILITL